jgi:hypothetical protein
MPTKFFLWSKTLWGVGLLNAGIVLWNAFVPAHQVTADQTAALNSFVGLFFRAITDGPISFSPVAK